MTDNKRFARTPEDIKNHKIKCPMCDMKISVHSKSCPFCGAEAHKPKEGSYYDDKLK